MRGDEDEEGNMIMREYFKYFTRSRHHLLMFREGGEKENE